MSNDFLEQAKAKRAENLTALEKQEQLKLENERINALRESADFELKEYISSHLQKYPSYALEVGLSPKNMVVLPKTPDETRGMLMVKGLFGRTKIVRKPVRVWNIVEYLKILMNGSFIKCSDSGHYLFEEIDITEAATYLFELMKNSYYAERNGIPHIPELRLKNADYKAYEQYVENAKREIDKFITWFLSVG